MSDIPIGFENALMASRYFGSGLTSLEVTRKLANSVSFWVDWDLLGFKIMPFRSVNSR